MSIKCAFQVVYLEPGQNYEIQTSNNSYVKVRATAGPVLGPPWQRPENGYLLLYTPYLFIFSKMR